MKTSPHHSHSAADEQASLWAARLDGDRLNDTQRAELDAWLAQDPSHRALLSQYCQLSADLEEQVPALVAAGGVSLPATADVPERKSWWSLPRLMTVSLAAAAAVAVAFVSFRPSDRTENVAVAPGQRSNHTLADGSRVELNANTRFSFENTSDKRLIRFGGGEALFIVAKDPARPFIVETPVGSVRVTGTTFNVRTDSSAQGYEVTVIEGSVQASSSLGTQTSQTVSLVAGDQFVARAEGQTKRNLSDADLHDALAWRQGRIVFKGVPLREAAARYAQYHGRTIHVDPAIGDRTVGGEYSIDDLRSFLNAVVQANEVDLTSDAGSALTLRPRRSL